MVFERVFVRIPSSIAGVKISFRAPSKKDPTPDQYVDRALRKAFVNAVTKAKAACSDLRRIQIGATAGSVTFRGKPHRRDVRAGLCIGAVNGVPIPRCGKGFAAAAERIEEGVYPVPKDEKYLLAAAALLLSLGVEEGVDRVVSPDLFASAGAPFMGWFLENRWRTLPGSLSLATWKETTWPAMVKAGKTGRAKEHVVVTVKVPRRRTRLKKVFDEKYDRR